MSRPTKQRITYLLSGYSENILTPEELRELACLLRENQHAADFQEVLAALASQHFLGEARVSDKWMDSMADHIIATGTEHEQRARPVFWTMARKLSAAAAVLFILLTGVLWHYIKTNRQGNNLTRIAQSERPDDIIAGGHSAVLTLADGSTITLDSSHSGRLAVQNGTDIIKTAGGSLRYSSPAAQLTSGPVSYNAVYAPRGGSYQVILPDGTKVWLNADSKLRYPVAFNGQYREVTLTGEAYFEVTHNAARPFKVHVAGSEIMVLGTSFNVNGYHDDGLIKTTLVEGKVQVATGSGKKSILHPGEQAQISNKDALNVLSDVDVAGVVAWKQGHFEFNNTDLATIMHQISRWYDIEVVFGHPAGDKRFGGGINRDQPLGNVLKILESNGVQFKWKDGKLIVNP